MIDSVLKYLSLITVAGAAISFVVGLVKYFDQRNREQRTKRFELFHDLMGRISAQEQQPNQGVALTQQVRCHLRTAALQGICLRVSSNSRRLAQTICGTQSAGSGHASNR